MTITWYGLSSFKITNVGDKVTIITDPFHKDSGLTPPRGGADIVLISKDDELHNYTGSLTGDPLVIRNAGEFDIQDIRIRGIYPNGPASNNPAVFKPGDDEEEKEESTPTVIYHLEVDDIRIGFLGVFGYKDLTEHQLEELGNVDLLIVPVGGNHGVVNWEKAAHIVNQVEPKYVVPCYFKQKGSILDLDSPDKFIKEQGGESKTEDRLTLKKKDLSVEDTQVVVLSPQR